MKLLVKLDMSSLDISPIMLRSTKQDIIAEMRRSNGIKRSEFEIMIRALLTRNRWKDEHFSYYIIDVDNVMPSHMAVMDISSVIDNSVLDEVS